MNANIRSLAVSMCSAAGAALAGPGGALMGNLAGGLLATVLPGASAIAQDLGDKLGFQAIQTTTDIIVKKLDVEEKQLINHDLQTAFRDALVEALHDVSGERCFPQEWRPKRDVPTGAVFSLNPQINLLWQNENPLAEQIEQFFKDMKKAVQSQKLLPLDPPAGQPASQVDSYLQAETPAALSDAFFSQVISPFLKDYRALIQELPELEQHLRRYLLDRNLVHLGEFLKTRTEAWRAFNRMMLEGLRAEVKDISSGQAEILTGLNALLEKSGAGEFNNLSDNLAELLAATGTIEKQMDERFDLVMERVVAQHHEVVRHLEALIASSGRVETKVDRVLRILEDGRYIIEGTPQVPLDEPPYPGEPPFKGLQFFNETDAGLYYGREELTARLVGRICEALAPPLQPERDGRLRFLAVVGASGSGKSSLVRAGLVPALRSAEPLADGSLPPEGSAVWPVQIITPTEHPLEALAASLTKQAASVTTTQAVLADLAAGPRSLHLHVRKTLAGSAARQLLLIVDQFEELFTLCRVEAERRAFIDNLLTATAAEGPLIVVITLRADFYAYCAFYENLRLALENHQVYIGPMSRDELCRAIEEPAERGGPDQVHWEFEPGLVDLILRDIGDEPGALPLLSHALLETWKNRRGRVMTLESYAESGGVRGAIAKTAETVYHHRLTPEQQPIARNIFMRLTELGEETQDTRRRASLDELILHPHDRAPVEAVLRTLSDARLVTINESSVEVAHEALIREWPTLRAWLDEDRQGLRLHRALTEAAHDWVHLNRDPGALYSGARLTQALEWAKDHGGQMSAQEREFLDTSHEAAEQAAREREAQRRRELEVAQQLAREAEARQRAEAGRARQAEQSAAQLRGRNRVITGVSVTAVLIAVVACVLGVMAGFFGLQSNRNARTAGMNLNTAQAANTQVVAEANVRATAEQQAIEQKSTAEAANTEAQLLSRISVARELAARSSSMVQRNQDLGLLMAIEAMRSANSLAGQTIPEAQTALYNVLETANFSTVLRGHTDQAWIALFSPDDKSILTASVDGTAYLWDLDGKRLAAFIGHSGQIIAASFSPQGDLLATASEDGTARIWKMDGTLVSELTEHEGLVSSVGFSPDGKRLVTSGIDRTARIWDTDGNIIKTLTGHLAWVSGVTYSPNGEYIVTLSTDNTIRLWTSEGELLSIFKGHHAWPVWVNFSPDSQKLVSASWDGTGRVWDLEGNTLAVLEGHTRSLNTAVFSSDGNYILTSAYDNTARLWKTDGTLVTVFQGHTGPLNSAFFSPDGQLISTAACDYTARLWRLDGTLLATLRGHSDFVYGAVFSHDQKWLVTGSRDKTARIWAVDELYNKILIGHTGTVTHGSFSPDGKTITTVGTDSKLSLWNADGTSITTTEALAQPYNSVEFSPAGDQIVTANFTDTIQVWSKDGESQVKIANLPAAVRWASFNPDASLIAAAFEDGVVRLFSSDGKLVREIHGHQGAVYMADFSPDGQKIVSAGDDGTARVWSLDGQTLEILDGHSGPVSSAVFSPDGKRILTASWDTTAILWTSDGIGLSRFIHEDTLTFARFSPDGKMIVTASMDGTAWVWRSDGTFITWLEGHTAWLSSATFSPDGKRILTTSGDGTARLWGVWGDVENMLAETQARVGRTMTTWECKQFLYTDSCPEMVSP